MKHSERVQLEEPRPPLLRAYDAHDIEGHLYAESITSVQDENGDWHPSLQAAFENGIAVAMAAPEWAQLVFEALCLGMDDFHDAVCRCEDEGVARCTVSRELMLESGRRFAALFPLHKESDIAERSA